MKRRPFSQRGAVFVESIIVIGMITLMLAAGLFLHRLYMNKFRAMSESRAAAWTGALRGCPTGLGLVGIGTAIWNSVEGLASCNASDGADCVVDGLTSSTTTDPPDWFGNAGANVPPRVTYTVGADRPLPFREKSVSAEHRVVCNETPQDEGGDLWSLIEYVRDSIWP
jgi:hypothetical protein